MKESKSNMIVGFLSGIVAAMLLLHIGMWGFSNRSNASSQAPTALPTVNIAISPVVKPSPAPDWAPATSISDQVDEVLVRPVSKAVRASVSPSTTDRRTAGPRPATNPTSSELTGRAPTTQPVPQGLAAHPQTAGIPGTAVPRKPSKMRKIFETLGKVALSSALPAQPLAGNIVQAITQPRPRSVQVSGPEFPPTNVNAMSVPMTPKLPGAMMNIGTSSTATAPSAAVTPVGAHKPGKLRRFFGVIGKRINIASSNAIANASAQPVVVPILPANSACTPQCAGDATRAKEAAAPGHSN